MGFESITTLLFSFSSAKIMSFLQSYAGPYLIRMTNLMLNEDNFKTSIATFIKKHQFATATRDDLWSIMTEIAHTNNVIPNDVAVKDIMDSWLTQAGYPFLRVKIDYSNNKVSISQVSY